jgi:hypothetical protein
MASSKVLRKETKELLEECVDQMTDDQVEALKTFVESATTGGDKNEEENTEEESPRGRRRGRDEEENTEEEEISSNRRRSREEPQDDGSADYSEMSLKELKALAVERGMDTKAMLAKSSNPERTLTKAHTQYDENEEDFMKKPLLKLEAIAKKNDVVWSKPRGAAKEATKKAAVVAALLAEGIEPV